MPSMKKKGKMPPPPQPMEDEADIIEPEEEKKESPQLTVGDFTVFQFEVLRRLDKIIEVLEKINDE